MLASVTANVRNTKSRLAEKGKFGVNEVIHIKPNRVNLSKLRRSNRTCWAEHKNFPKNKRNTNQNTDQRVIRPFHLATIKLISISQIRIFELMSL